MMKTRGKKNPTPIIALVLIVLAAVTLLLIRPDFKSVQKRPVGQAMRKSEGGAQSGTHPDRSADSAISHPAESKKIAIIIDDVGHNSAHLEQYRGFRGKLTFSILPFLDETSSSATFLHNEGFEIMIHIPMEPIDYPDRNPGRGALLLDDTKEDVERKLSAMIRTNPFAKGANNHMGSLATQNEKLMSWTLSYLQQRDFYFIDSLTTGNSKAFDVSRSLSMSSSRRDVFLDNSDDFTYINGQFELLKETARKNGTAIGIGHIQQQNLLGVLNRQILNLDEEGFEMVFASEVLSN
jgi:polysaccharide deacetylase 2 family uncharacterized protein YibQ